MAMATPAHSLQAAPLSVCKQAESLCRLQLQERLASSPSSTGPTCAAFTIGTRLVPGAMRPRGSCGPARAELATATSAQTSDAEDVAVAEGDDAGDGGAALGKVQITTLKDCRLGIAMYPDFVYNAEGGGGTGSARKLQEDGRVAVEFDPRALFIPPVQSSTTRFLGLPLPPFVCIQVIPDILKGVIDQRTGKVELEFSARFMFSVGSWYRAPALHVDTLLTTELAQGRLRQGQGKRLDSQTGECRLVGVAPLAPIDDLFLNAFLTLPTDCLAIMSAKFTFFD